MNTAEITLGTKKWGWSLLKWEKMTLTYNGDTNIYYGFKILGLKVMIWHHTFDET